MGEFGIGQSIKRFEDGRLLRGGGRFNDDVNVAGQTHAVIVRSIHAHARIRGIEVEAAKAMPGVVRVVTGAESSDVFPSASVASWAGQTPALWMTTCRKIPNSPQLLHKARARATSGRGNRA